MAGKRVDQIRLSVCSSCAGVRDRGAEQRALRQALDRAGLADRVDLGEHACFSSCDTAIALSLQGPRMASYVFSGIDVGADADDIAATCQVYLDSPAGWIEDARPCGRLRLCLHARIPAFQST